MSILDSILTKRQKEAGYYVTEWVDHLELRRGGNKLVSYPCQSVTIDQIRHDADQEIEWGKSGVVFERKV